MSESLGDLLAGKSKAFAEPPEVKQIKLFMRENFSADCQVAMQQWQIVITVRGASLGGALRMRVHELKEQLGTKKRLVIRIQS